MDWQEKLKNKKLVKVSDIKLVVNPPVVNPPVVNSPVVNPPVVNSPVVNPPVVNPPVVNPPVVNPPVVKDTEDKAEEERDEVTTIIQNGEFAKDYDHVKLNKNYNGLLIAKIEAKDKNCNDLHVLEWGRERNSGFVIGQIQKPSPMFFTADGHSIKFEDSAKGQEVLLIGSIGSIKNTKDHVISVNNSKLLSSFNIITDDNIDISIWNDPSTIKIVPLSFAHVKNKISLKLHSHYPHVFYFMRCKSFNISNFFHEDAFYHEDSDATTSLITAIKICYVVGYRKIKINGFIMSDHTKTLLGYITELSQKVGLIIQSI